LKKEPRTSLPDLALLQREINQLFERLGGFDRAARPGAVEWFPSVDVYECRGALVVVVEVPGLAPESLRVVCQDRQLTVSGERRDRRPAEKGAAFLCLERPQGRFVRAIPLDAPVDVRQTRARLSGGLLTVNLPRLRDRRGRGISITVEREDE
jgi:HSP20 family protein